MMHRPARPRLLILLLAAALALSGCGSLGPGRTPSGTTATKRIDAAGVTRLDVAHGFDVRVSLGQPEAVTITYDDNLADLLDVRVEGRTLRLQLQPNSDIDHRPTLRAEVTMSRLEEIRSAGASTVTVADKLPGASLGLLVSGSSRVAAADLAVNRAEATVSGSSRLELTGTANALSAQGSGASNLELADLHLQDLDIKLSGASHGNVNVTGTIAAQVAGASNLTYTGSPQFTKRDTSGGSSIQPG
jgi:Putative auto-transporter adhesin, head GIN domain